MSPKEIFLEFLNMVFILALVAFCITFFIVGDRFAEFTTLLQALMPISIFGIFYLIKLKLSRVEYKKRKEESGTDLTLYLGFQDKMISEAIIFLTPMGMCVIFYLTEGMITALEIVQASLVFIILFFWQRYLFGKSR